MLMFKESFLTEKAANIHYEGHYLKYVEKVKSWGYKREDYADIIKEKKPGPLYNNVAQILNHEFFDDSIGGAKNLIYSPEVRDFKNELESKCNFKKIFLEKTTELFGSGWVWLIYDGEYRVIVTHNGDYSPYLPICTLDLWEHSYYVDFLANRLSYAENFIDHGINWNRVWEKHRQFNLSI